MNSSRWLQPDVVFLHSGKEFSAWASIFVVMQDKLCCRLMFKQGSKITVKLLLADQNEAIKQARQPDKG